MGTISRVTITSSIAAVAAGLLVLALPLTSAQAAPKTVNPVGTWKLTGLQIADAPVTPCPTTAAQFNERWYCKGDTMLKLKTGNKFSDNIPFVNNKSSSGDGWANKVGEELEVKYSKGTWYSNNTNSIVFDYVGDSGLDARVYAMSIKGKTMKISREAIFGPPSATATPVVLHMIFTKQ